MTCVPNRNTNSTTCAAIEISVCGSIELTWGEARRGELSQSQYNTTQLGAWRIINRARAKYFAVLACRDGTQICGGTAPNPVFIRTYHSTTESWRVSTEMMSLPLLSSFFFAINDNIKGATT